VQDWLNITEWSQDNIDYNTIDKIQNKLLELEIIPKKVNYEDLVCSL
jgi:predicted nuclease of restriction endonuclease-like (RecB) superfamily